MTIANNKKMSPLRHWNIGFGQPGNHQRNLEGP